MLVVSGKHKGRHCNYQDNKIMATRKKQPTEQPKTILIKPRDVFKSELSDRITIGEDLFNRNIQQFNELDKLKQDFSNWDDYNEELIKRAFNNQYSEYYHEYSRVNQMVGFYDYMRGVNTNNPAYKVKEAKEQIENCITILKRLIDKLPLIEQDSSISSYQIQERTFYNCGFVVHGHNDTIKLEVARYIENDLKRKAIILHEQANKGQTIIEKFESNSTVDFAVVLWTADDVGKAKSESDSRDRARQNVIFETGFFIGALGRENVIILYEDGVEIPSDYSGVIFIRLADNWKDNLRKEIEAIYQL
jgi:predicted nucleotide-binding protein